ncbi:hypothetical protein DFA_11386 [Cavenderia fasciculata]|uniref:Enoyl reductase (ER) domain-containing protein n=1 Tax=Cavenderia fasciculata TaxID=261658 RepID=F4QCP3_CACFS|nr:uncharacterized protein DFA_11386 [Cavenderia fasciculata]EGG13625.1 hypothetical protein DFA_11386 [Cavenderia fasciculata]|eukprot:XP_004350329.1 hypothetical protein DFA_11386 [Cavenderia fasciculata]
MGRRSEPIGNKWNAIAEKEISNIGAPSTTWITWVRDAVAGSPAFEIVAWLVTEHNCNGSASIPVAMGTAYVVLVKKAGIEPFESILIHNSTGGVGLTMFNLLKHQQHTGKVFVTVGSDEKKQYLEQQYGSLITALLF